MTTMPSQYRWRMHLRPQCSSAPLPERRPKVSELFIEADEDHVAMQQGNSRQLRLAYVYEGKVAEGKKRRTLTAKRVFTGYGMPWKEIKEYIQTLYDSPEITIIYGRRGGVDTERDGVPGKEPMRHGRISCCQILEADGGDGNDPTSV